VRTTTNADGTQKHEMVGDYTTLPLDETGKGIYKVRGTTIGPKSWGGLISLKAPDGTLLSFPFTESYTVGAQNVVISPTAMNVLYESIENPIDISVPGVGSDKIRVSMKNGRIERGQVKNTQGVPFPGEWKVIPEVVGQMAQINVSAEINGKLQPFPPRDFRVKALPKPTAQFAGITGEGEQSKAVMMAQPVVLAVLEGFDFDLRYNITEFRFTINDKGFDVFKDSKTARVTDEQRALLNNLRRGSKLYIERIKAVGPNKRPIDLSPVIIVVQ
jgi:gliding motility-associated protein GldM